MLTAKDIRRMPRYESGCEGYDRRWRFFLRRSRQWSYLGKSLQDSVEIGTRLAASAIASYENVCPEIDPEEFGLS